MNLKDELMWVFDPSEVEQSYRIAEQALEAAKQTLQMIDELEKSGRWFSSQQIAQRNQVKQAVLKLIDQFGGYGLLLTGAPAEVQRDFIKEFITNKIDCT